MTQAPKTISAPGTSAPGTLGPGTLGSTTQPFDVAALEQIWASSPTPLMVLDDALSFCVANPAAEAFFGASEAYLRKRTLSDLCGEDSRPVALARAALSAAAAVLTEYAVELTRFDHGSVQADLQAVRLAPGPSRALLQIHPQSSAAAIGRNLDGRAAARSLSGLASMLAHEIKNPLAGISGAAQLLEMSLGDDEAEMVRVILAETERIRVLVDRITTAGDDGPSRREPVNLHVVLDTARRAAEVGFARHARIRAEYDPSLPPTVGDPDRLLQVIANLIKNAVEAVGEKGTEITIRTAYRPGMRIALGDGARERLPLEVTVLDNGPGVPEALQPHIFSPFVTSKSSGDGLGLAVAAKIIADHGGVIDYRRTGSRSAFRLLLPVWSGGSDATNAAPLGEEGETHG